jgi:hypothetical protein
MRRGDYRFLGIVELGEWIPGVQDRPDATEKYGVRFIEGTGDDVDAVVEDSAREYAEIFNRLLLRRLKTSGKISAIYSHPASAATVPAGSDPLVPAKPKRLPTTKAGVNSN